jgi:pimeloyl-ACP methyl ester carboxylesterase
MPATTSVLSDLHHEIRGFGRPVLFISGMTGDAGHFTRAAERLADEFTTVTYDRRGNSRSVEPSAVRVGRLQRRPTTRRR